MKRKLAKIKKLPISPVTFDKTKKNVYENAYDYFCDIGIVLDHETIDLRKPSIEKVFNLLKTIPRRFLVFQFVLCLLITLTISFSPAVLRSLLKCKGFGRDERCSKINGGLGCIRCPMESEYKDNFLLKQFCIFCTDFDKTFQTKCYPAIDTSNSSKSSLPDACKPLLQFQNVSHDLWCQIRYIIAMSFLVPWAFTINYAISTKLVYVARALTKMTSIATPISAMNYDDSTYRNLIGKDHKLKDHNLPGYLDLERLENVVAWSQMRYYFLLSLPKVTSDIYFWMATSLFQALVILLLVAFLLFEKYKKLISIINLLLVAGFYFIFTVGFPTVYIFLINQQIVEQKFILNKIILQSTLKHSTLVLKDHTHLEEKRIIYDGERSSAKANELDYATSNIIDIIRLMKSTDHMYLMKLIIVPVDVILFRILYLILIAFGAICTLYLFPVLAIGWKYDFIVKQPAEFWNYLINNNIK